MRTATATTLLAGLIWAAADGAETEVVVGDAVVVRLDDGRIVRGTVEAATTSDRLVLGISEPGVSVTSSFATARIVALYDATEWAAESGELVVIGIEPEPRDVLSSIERIDRLSSPIGVGRVRSLFVEARVANWDRDAESDGLLVRVVPLDGYGRVVPVTGSLSFDLHVQRLKTSRKLPWVERDRAFDETDRWGRALESDTVGPDGVVLKLPFRSLRPERDLDIAPDALLRARLVVPGQGTFEATDAHVRLRPYSRFRDELEQQFGQRGVPRLDLRRSRGPLVDDR